MIIRDRFECEDGIVRADLRGVITDQAWSYVFCKTLALAGIHQTRNLLIDLRGASVPASAFALKDLPPVLEYISLSKLYRIALVLGYRGREYAFCESAFRKGGFTVQMFTDYQQARNWLKPNQQHLN